LRKEGEVHGGRGKKHYLAYWKGQRGAERNPLNYSRRDDGSHIFHNADEYYEWWYFDASFTNGHHTVITFHYRNLFLRPMAPTVQIFVYKPDGARVERYELVPDDRARANPDYCHVVMGENWIRDCGDRYELFLDIKGVGAHLTFTNLVPAWKPGQGFNYLNEEEGLTAGWVVPVPRAAVTGKLFLKGETLEVEGSGYHDHNWGNFPCHKVFKGWYWGGSTATRVPWITAGSCRGTGTPPWWPPSWSPGETRSCCPPTCSGPTFKT
jgi:hypothetical protein